MSDLHCPNCGETVAKAHKVYDLRGTSDTNKAFDIKIAHVEKTTTEYQVFYLCEKSNRIFGVFSRESSELKGMTHDAAGAPVEPLSIVTDDVKDASKETVTEQQNWLKDKYPRVWDFLKAVNVIRSESDFYGLEDQLMKLFQVQALAEMERPLSGLKGSFQLIQAQKIAIAILVSKKNIPPKKHWWS